MIISGVAIAALVLPIVILGPRPGLEIVQPLAVVLLGGVVSSLIVALFLLPSAYLQLIPPRAEEAPPEHEDELRPVVAATGA
jgi:Cu/Ag efflux pump CusA